ncbi:helix-hairpin-helix domain-containing protein [Dolichospermum heterosporum]|uniref:Protein kinase domain-containing protein n=1 Tax=Dolichospermum heterosporum TAC447 TaxID=747523 RepID=A0ABY5M396_9CYAN|nr:hypothetical protein [Dolichospermum heterosporum]UUO17674.1 hypothetical protein NG743_12185 [Dolichospermum heterosporum TAC447]
MTVLTCASTGKSITLLKEIANSGEAKVWRTNQNGYLAKIYHSPTPERVQKLAVMIANPPTEPNSHLHHISFAWPKSGLKNDQGDFVGFLMPEIKDGKELIDVYNPQRRKQLKLEIDWQFLHTTALNIVSIIEALHAAGYVLGDIKPQNILVNNRALPSIIDTDSFQVKNPKNGKVYRCLVGSPGYTPPELMGKDFDIIEQTEIHDRFRLGVIIYQLLFGGNNHFQGKWTGAGEPPEPDEIIRRGLWLYSPNSLIEPVPRTIPMIIVHPAIRECFLKCFNDGHKNPNLRPTAREWLKALRTGNDNLTICGRVDSHYYSRTFGNCYWCDRSTNLGIDIFPGKAASTSKPITNYSLQNLKSLNSQKLTIGGNNTIQLTPNFSSQNLTKAHKRSWWFGLILSYCVILILPTTLYLIQVGRNINTKDAGAYFKRGVSRSKFPITSESNGVTFSVESVSYSGGDLLIRVNMQNKGTNSVRFLYSFLDITDNKGRTLSAITEGLPAKLPPNSREFSGTVSIPTALLDDVNKISLSLVDYPDQKVKLNLVDIPVKPFESQKSTYDELNNIIVTATEDSDKLYQAQALAKNLNIESLLQAIRLADSIKQDSYLYQKSQKLIAELGRNILKLAQEQMDRRNADTALEIARNIPPIPSLQSEIDDFLVLGEAQNSAFIGTVAGLETAISQAQQIDTSRKVYKKAQELIARWQLKIEDLSPQ